MTTTHTPVPSPTRREVPRSYGSAAVLLAAGGVALLCGVFVHPNGYVWLAAVAFVGALGLVGPWLAVAGLRAELTFGRDRCREGEAVAATLRCRGRALALRGGLHLDGDPAVGRPMLKGANGAEVALSITPPRFGLLPASPLFVSSSFPFGLWTARRPVRVARPAVAWPATAPVGPMPDVGGATNGPSAARRVGAGGEPCGVRDFRDGDRLRLVHWAQSAKHDRLVVRETLADATPRVRVGLVTSASAYGGAAAFDAAIRLAASCCEGWTRAGGAVELVVGPTRGRAGGLRVACPPNARPRAALDALATLDFDELADVAPVPAADVFADARSSWSPTRTAGGAA